jgi:hypothetical protein
VVKRLSPRNVSSLRRIEIIASAAAWKAKSSSSGPLIRSWADRREISARAARSSIS